MTSFVHPYFPTQHRGAAKVAALGTVLTLLSQVAARGRAALQAWREQTHMAEEDHKLWQLAMSDARVMAEISRAMKRGAPNKVAFY